MMEQAEVQAGARGPKMPVRGLSDEVRASLEAVRIAREAAHERARRQTLRARLWFVALAGGVAAATFAVGPRVAHWWQGRSHAATPAVTPTPAPEAPVAAATSVPAAAAAIPSTPAPAATIADAPAAPAPELAPPAKPAAPPSKVAASQDSRGGGVPAEECDAGLVHTTPWLLSPDACARAFEANPNNAALALGIAHAEHVRGHFAESAQWANRALALEPKAAEAYVLIARAATEDGRPDDAQAAYRRYLELAPRGWHQAEARTGVRRARAAAPHDSTGNR
jgi:hypothetical protein